MKVSYSKPIEGLTLTCFLNNPYIAHEVPIQIIRNGNWFKLINKNNIPDYIRHTDTNLGLVIFSFKKK